MTKEFSIQVITDNKNNITYKPCFAYIDKTGLIDLHGPTFLKRDTFLGIPLFDINEVDEYNGDSFSSEELAIKFINEYKLLESKKFSKIEYKKI